MHFFNPPTKMRLVEVVAGRPYRRGRGGAGPWAGPSAGQDPGGVPDSPNFMVNRICRPLYYEAQLLVSQGVPAGVVDAVARGRSATRWGHWTLLDFTGLHTHLGSSETACGSSATPATGRSHWQGAGPRRRTGRAAGVGFYDYQQEKPSAARARLTTPAPPPDGTKLRLAGPDAAPLRADERIAAVVDDTAPLVLYRSLAAGDQQHLAEVAALRAAGATVVVDSSAGDWLETLPPGVGWLRLHTPPAGPFAEVVDDPVAGIHPTPGVERVLAAVGAASVRVPALPGLVADRLAHCLINEAVLVVEEGTADPEAVDTALRLGMNHPVGPLELLAQHGPAQVYTSLCGMLRWLGDPRYRPTPLLRRQAAGARRTAAVGA